MINEAQFRKWLVIGSDGVVRFNGEKCVINVPLKYEKLEFLKVEHEVTILGIFKMNVDGENIPLCLPAKLIMVPSEISNITINSEPFYSFVLYRGDIFAKTIQLVQDTSLNYPIYKEFFFQGNIPSFIDYEHIFQILDNMKLATGFDPGMNHSLNEIHVAQVCRDPKNKDILYRHSDSTEPPLILSIADTSQVTDTDSGRFIGGYMADGIVASAVRETKVTSELEDLVRS